MRKFFMLGLVLMFSLTGILSGVAIADGSAEVVFDTASIANSITEVLHTGDDLCLPRIKATLGTEDVTAQVSVSVYDSQSTKVNTDGSFVAEDLTAGVYTVIYSVGEAVSSAYTVTVSDGAPSAALDSDKRPAEIAYRDVVYRVRALTVGEGSTVTVSLYDINGSVVDSDDQGTLRQIPLMPSKTGWNNVTYKVVNGSETVLCSFPIYVDIKDYTGDFFGHSFEGDTWLDAYNLAIWCNSDTLSDGIECSISKEESRSGSSSVKFTSVDPSFQPTLVFALDFDNTMTMRKDDVTKYTIRFWVKLGDDLSYDGYLPMIDFHILAKKTSTDTNYGAYKWTLGNFMIKQPGEDGWALAEYDFISYSDEYVFSQDWLNSSPNYDSYGGMQFVIEVKNYTGTIYIDDISLFKKGVTVADPLEEFPHDDGFVYDDPQQSDKKGCSSSATNSLLLIGVCMLAVVLRIR